jgi:choline-sulfatase
MSSKAVPVDDNRRKRPNILIILCDEMRYPTVYESEELKAYRKEFLKTQELLRRNGLEFHRHYAASVACVPSRASLYTGQYPSLHGVIQTTGAAKSAPDPSVFWFDPNSVPTMGEYFRTGGYRTFWHGKWHASDADLLTPGTHNPITSYNDETGEPDPKKVAQYRATNRLNPYGFDGWIGPEPHGKSPLNSGSSSSSDAPGRDECFAQQATALIEALDGDTDDTPWLAVASFVNPHDITLYGFAAQLGDKNASEGQTTFEFTVHETVPFHLFKTELFDRSLHEDLSTKPTCQKSYQEQYRRFMQPVIDRERYSRFYYQLHRNVDEQMMKVYQALRKSRFYEDTIVVFTSDHGDLLGAHGDLHQKWYMAYDEAIHVPLIISNPVMFPEPQSTLTLTGHVDLLPTLLGLAGLDAGELIAKMEPRYTDIRALVGRDLTALVLGQDGAESLEGPLYFMTDDDPSRGPDQETWTGVAYNSVVQPNHIECVITRLGGPGENGKIWKYARYFDNPQFWSTPGYPENTNAGAEDVVVTPPPGQLSNEEGTETLPYTRSVKLEPAPDEFEMYCVTDDPMELSNLAGNPDYAAEQKMLADLLVQQSAAKRLRPISGNVPGQPLPAGGTVPTDAQAAADADT